MLEILNSFYLQDCTLRFYPCTSKLESFVQNIQHHMKVLLISFHLNDNTIQFHPGPQNFKQYLGNRSQVSMVYRLMRDVGRKREEFVNHEPQANDLRILLFSNNYEEAQFFHGFTSTINHN